MLAKLPAIFDQSRSTAAEPDPKRFRDPKQVYETTGFLCVVDERIRLTAFGKRVYDWLPVLNRRNARVLGQHALAALAACQLRNPTGAGERYDPSIRVYPFSFIWRAMLALDWKISSEELNRAIFRTTNDEDLAAAIDLIRQSRTQDDPAIMGERTIDGPKGVNDRVIPWICLASFGWTLIPKKAESGGEFYEIPVENRYLFEEAAQIRHKHRDFGSAFEYVDFISKCAALPKDLR